MSVEPTLIHDNQAKMLRTLLVKKGWSEAYFAWQIKKPLAELTAAEARKWLTRLTKETKGKAKPATLLEPPEVNTSPVKPRRKVEPAPPEPAAPPLPAVVEGR